MKPDDLLTPTGAYDKAAIMRDAHRQRRLMARHGWTWSRCLSFSWTKARAMRERLNAEPDRPERLMVRPTAEGVAALYTAITGKSVSADDMARFADRMASLELNGRCHRRANARGAADRRLSQFDPKRTLEYAKHPRILGWA